MTLVSSNAALLGADTHPAIFAAVIEKTNMSSCTEYLFKKKKLLQLNVLATNGSAAKYASKFGSLCECQA